MELVLDSFTTFSITCKGVSIWDIERREYILINSNRMMSKLFKLMKQKFNGDDLASAISEYENK
jgi:hypothetical protein